MSDQNNQNPSGTEKPADVPTPDIGATPTPVPSAVPASAPMSAAVSKAEAKAEKAKAKADAKLAKVREKQAKLEAKRQAKSPGAAPASPQEPAQQQAGSEPAAPKPTTAAAEPGDKVIEDSTPQSTAPVDPKAEAQAAAETQPQRKESAPAAQPAPNTERQPAKDAAAQATVPRTSTAVPEPAAPPKDPQSTEVAAEPENAEASRRRRKLDKARAAAAKDAENSPARKKTGAIVLSTVSVAAAGALVAAGSLWAPAPSITTLPAAVTSLPAGDAVSVCPGTPQLLEGVDGTDPEFAPGAEEISSNIRSAVVSDLAKRIPGSSLAPLGSSDKRELTDRIPDSEASEARSADDEGLTGREAKVSTVDNAEEPNLFAVQPLGELPSMGSALRSYQAKDGDLAGLAAASCLAPAANWRFTGLQTTTGSTSVLHLGNPTSTSAQVAVDLRGPDGLVDSSTLQNLVIAPGEERVVVLGGYAHDMNSVAAAVTSTGGKVTAYVQQAALRGLTPSGVDLVAPNASASNTQVIPGVWIDSKDNSDKLSADDASLIPQLHVAAAGSQGAGFTVSVLNGDGEVDAKFEQNLSAASDATATVDLKGLDAGYYTIVVQADAPVTAAARLVRGSDPEDPSDTAWAVSTLALAGSQVMPLSANGTGKFVLASPESDSEVEAVVVSKDGKLSKSQKLSLKANSSVVFDPRDTTEDAQAVIFSSDANAHIAQVVLGSDQSIAWARMPQANAGREGIVVNVAG